jgi:hypothetical protein
MFLKVLKIISAIILSVIVVTLVIVNIRLYSKPDVLQELKDLKAEIDRGADVEMQKIYPEGYVFMNATYALACSSLLKNDIDEAWIKINDDHSLPPGSFYVGWNTYILGLDLKAGKNNHVIQFKQQCDSIASSLQHTTYPESYPGAAWPADVTVCVASLALHDKLYESKYQGVIKKWINEVSGNLDDRGMIPHSLYENARGSSMALMLIFLKDIDRDLAESQFRLFKENFVDHKFGIAGIREYPKGDVGSGDVDSGPVIMGFGGAATLVGMQTLALYGEGELSIRIRQGVDAILPRDVLPIADGFITWSHANMAVDEPTIWFIEFHFYSMLLGILLIFSIWKLR